MYIWLYMLYIYFRNCPSSQYTTAPKKEIRMGGPCSVQNGKSSATNTWLGKGRMVKAKNKTMKQILANTLGAYISSKTAASQSPTLVVSYNKHGPWMVSNQWNCNKDAWLPVGSVGAFLVGKHGLP